MVTKSMIRKAEAWWRPYIDPEVTIIKQTNVGKDNKMSKNNKATESVAKNSKKYAPSRMEVFKTVMIAVLVTAIIAFIAGMQFANKQAAAVSAAQTQTTAVAPAATSK